MNLVRNKAHTAINLTGLAVGLTCGLLTLLWVQTEFFGLVGTALLIAAPLSWYGMREWLGGYAYHTNMPWWVFVAAAGLVFVIALVTVSFQAIKAALVNPIRSLRSE